MIEIIEALNNTSEARALLYLVAFVITIAILADVILAIIKSFRK